MTGVENVLLLSVFNENVCLFKGIMISLVYFNVFMLLVCLTFDNHIFPLPSHE